MITLFQRCSLMLLASALCALWVLPSHAAVVTLDLQAEQGGSSSDETSLPQHSIPWPDLELVTMRLSGTISGQLDVANNEPKYDIIYGTLAGRLVVLDGSNVEVLSLDLTQTGYFELDPNSSYSFMNLGDSRSIFRTYSRGVDDLTPFIGSGSLPYTISLSDLSFAVTGSGAPATTYFTQVNGHVEFEINYTTTYIPEPGNLVIMGIVFAICMSVRRFQREQRHANDPLMAAFMARVSAISSAAWRSDSAPSVGVRRERHHQRNHRRRRHSRYTRLFGLTVAVLPFSLSVARAGNSVELTRLSVQQDRVILQWDQNVDRFIIERFSLTPEPTLAVATSTGLAERSVSWVADSGTLGFYRLRPDLAAVFFADPLLDAVIRAGLGAQRAGPTNWIYDTEVNGLATLRLSRSGLQWLDGVGALAGLSLLDAGGNKIGGLAGVGACSGLLEVRLEGNTLTSLAGLEGLSNLQTLDVSRNQVNSLAPLSGLSGLRELYADGNKIADISPLAGLLTLQVLDLAGNQISDLTPLLNNAQQGGLGAGDVVYLAGNPLNQPGQVAALRGYGVTVYYP